MEFINQNIEIFKLIGSLIAALAGGGGVAYLTLPLLIEKMKADIRKQNIDTAASAIEMGNEAFKLAEQANKKANHLEEILQGDLMISGQFSMEEVIKTGTARLSGTVTRLNRISTIVD